MNVIDCPEWKELSFKEKMETVISILDTPIMKRKIGDPVLSAAIAEINTKFPRKVED